MNRRRREAVRRAAEARDAARKQERKRDKRPEAEAARKALSAKRGFTEQTAYEILRGDWTHPDPNVCRCAKALREVAHWSHASWQTENFRALFKLILARAPKIAEASYWIPCYSLCRAGWVRPPADWEPEGKSGTSIFHSLVNHMLVRHPIPKFLYSAFSMQPGHHSYAYLFVNLFRAVAGGASAYEYVRSNMPLVFTRRMCHVFMQTPAGTDIFWALRHAQVRVVGGDRRLNDAICSSTSWGFVRDEERWFRVIRWFCAQSGLDKASVPPLVDFVAHAVQRPGGFEIEGRTVASLTRLMEAWHRELAERRAAADDAIFKPSGLKGGTWEGPRDAGAGAKYDWDRITWTLQEILTSNALAEEGSVQGHCVYSYRGKIEEGWSSIWSLRVGLKRMLTIEVDNHRRAIIQARGRLNRSATPAEMAILARWARKNGLQMRV